MKDDAVSTVISLFRKQIYRSVLDNLSGLFSGREYSDNDCDQIAEPSECGYSHLDLHSGMESKLLHT